MKITAPSMAQRPEMITKNNIKPLHPVLSPQNNISFKGGAATLITEADQQLFNVFSQHYGDIGNRIGEKLGKLATSSEVLKKGSRFTLEKGVTSIHDKGVVRALAENVLFPFVNLPLYGASWVAKKAQSVPFLKTGAEKVYKSAILRVPRKLNEIDQKTDIIKGMYEKTQDTVKKFAKEKGLTPEYLLQQLNKADDTPQAQQLVKEANEYIKESLYKVSNKFFDKHTGNFNTAYERPLNRIVTGLIPILFLANDAYNLSVICGDKKEDSKKEAKERTSQELSRVFTTAYIQLLTFGAFTKQVNTIPWFTPLTSAATVLFSEISSRKRLGKPVMFLSKEKAKEYNENKKNKSAEKTESKKLFSFGKNDKKVETPQAAATTKPEVKTEKTVINDISTPIAVNEPKIFAGFNSLLSNDAINAEPVKQPAEQKETKPADKKDTKERKALINFNTFKKGVIILVTGGFVLSFLKNSSYTKNTKLVKGIKDFGEFCKKKIYNPLAFKDFEMPQAEFQKITQSLKDAGCKDIAEGHEFIKEKYGKQAADGIIKMYKASLSKGSAKDVAAEAITALKDKGVALTDKELTQITESVKTAIGLEGSSIAEMKYSSVAKKAAEIIKNKKVNLNEEEFNLLKDTITNAISTRAKEAPVQIETKLKPFVDIVTQPFKFIMSAMKLPYKLAHTIVNLAVSPVEKKAAEAALGKAELSKFEQSIHKAVTEIFGEKSAKAGKTSQVIFTNAMEQLQKQTMPFRKAEEALKRATQSGSQAEIDKARTAFEKAKKDLMVYVNTAVEKSFNGVTQSSNKNTDLAMMSKLASSAVTSAFLVADNYNMVMLKSNGEDKEGAKEKANERIIQRLSALFYQSLLINWFNATFRSTYNSSLRGMTAVAIPNTLTTEVLTRKSIGMPIGRKSYEELVENEEKNENRKGFLGKYFKFMRLLTGKKPLKDRMPKDKSIEVQSTTARTDVKPVSSTSASTSTNLLERLSK